MNGRAVYVDAVMPCSLNADWHWPVACHLIADTLEDLHAFAARLGLKRSWFQPAPPHRIAHYDLTRGMRARAVALGAVELTREEFVAKVQAYRLGQEGVRLCPDV